MLQTEAEAPPIVQEPKANLYTIKRLENGFNISREGFINADVFLQKSTQLIIDFKDTRPPVSIPVLSYYILKESLVEEIFTTWLRNRSDHRIVQITPRNMGHIGKKLKEWVKDKFTKGIGSYIYPEWKNIIAELDPRIAAIQKKFLVVRGPKAKVPLILSKLETYQNENLVNDLLSYNSIYMCLDGAELEDGKALFY